MDENVVSLASRGIVDPVTLEDIRDRVEAVREVFIESVAEQVYLSAVEAMYRAGFDLDSHELDMDAAMLYQSMKSILMKSRGMTHPFQAVAEESFEYDEDGDIVVRKVIE